MHQVAVHDGQAIGVAGRQGGHRALVAIDAKVLGDRHRIAQQVALRQAHHLRAAGAAGGGQQQGQVLVQRTSLAARRRQQHLAEAAPQQPPSDERVLPLGGQQDRCRAVGGHQRRQLFRREGRVQHQGHGAGRQQAQVAQQAAGQVGGQADHQPPVQGAQRRLRAEVQGLRIAQALAVVAQQQVAIGVAVQQVGQHRSGPACSGGPLAQALRRASAATAACSSAVSAAGALVQCTQTGSGSPTSSRWRNCRIEGPSMPSPWRPM
jgi:hypothetical protein